MPTHLWRRPSGWTFQRRVPSHLVDRFGKLVRRSLGSGPIDCQASL
ncbi:DUF6538 domain-containing protein [Xanthobacter variabilis]